MKLIQSLGAFTNVAHCFAYRVIHDDKNAKVQTEIATSGPVDVSLLRNRAAQFALT